MFDPQYVIGHDLERVPNKYDEFISDSLGAQENEVYYTDTYYEKRSREKDFRREQKWKDAVFNNRLRWLQLLSQGGRWWIVSLSVIIGCIAMYFAVFVIIHYTTPWGWASGEQKEWLENAYSKPPKL